MPESRSGFKNSQLNDTRLITKYASHYLKSLFNKVEVQKGNVTADFRKILGIIPKEKLRQKHSHHAIDAAVLSCIIPSSSVKRDKILKLFYEIQEMKKLNQFTDGKKQELDRGKRNCSIGDTSDLVRCIEENILIYHVSKDQTFTPVKRKARQKSGKEFIVENKNGERVSKWIRGDTIRGKLHQDSFYGKIRIVERNEKGEPVRNSDGSWKYKTDQAEFKYVKRIPIEDFCEDDFKKVNNPELVEIIKNQLNKRTPLKKAIEDGGVFMINRKGEKVNKIRHIRRIEVDVKNPFSIKDFNNLPERIRIRVKKIDGKFLIEGVDFKMDLDGEIYRI